MTTICGIAGFIISDKDFGKINTERMTEVLARLMQQRGQDATGVCTVSPRGRVELRKEAVKAEVFLAGRKGIGRSAQTCLIHTRAATQGKPDNPLNNHPIRYEDIIGIHNGMVRNDDDLFDVMQWERKAQVDSEAIFASIHHYPKLEDGLKAIDASWAIAWINQSIEPRTLWLARGKSNPLFYARTTEGSTIFASTKSAVEAALHAGGLNIDPKGDYVTEADQGFLACVDVDGTLETFPKFDFSGLHAVEDPKRARLTNWSGDWENASHGYWRGGASGKPVHPSSPYRVPAAGAGAGAKEGDLRQNHVVGEGWIQQRYSAGVWHKQRPLTALEINAMSPAQKSASIKQEVTERQVVPYAMTSSSHERPPAEGDRVEIGVRLAISSDDTFDLVGTIMEVTAGGELVIDFDACHVPVKVPFRHLSSISQTGA